MKQSFRRNRNSPKNYKGQLYKKTTQGKTIQYEYDIQGNTTRIIDPLQGVTEFGYYFNGKKEYVKDENTGRKDYTYDDSGNLLTETDSNGTIISYEYDELNRLTRTSTNNPDDGEKEFYYDEKSSPNSIGKITTVVDDSGTSSFAYNSKGSVSKITKTMDEYDFTVKREYDNLNRPKSLTYPDGTKLNYVYTNYGSLQKITVDSRDGASSGHSIIEYEDKPEDHLVVKTFGNGVVEKVTIDPIKNVVSNVQTILAGETSPTKSLSYTYDSKGNITKITDNIYSSKSQNYVYDSLNRLTQSTTESGTENYVYQDNGNVTQRGQTTLYYENTLHKNAVSRSYSQSEGEKLYDYDSIGNMTSRNGDELTYNGFSQLVSYKHKESEYRIFYTYDSAGIRSKEVDENNGVIKYFIADLFEMKIVPGQGTEQTVYYRDKDGNLLAQEMRKSDSLIASNGNADAGSTKVAGFLPNFIIEPACRDLTVDCRTFYKNRFIFETKKLVQTVLFLDSGFRISNLTRVLAIAVVLFILYIFYFFLRSSFSNNFNLFNYFHSRGGSSFLRSFWFFVNCQKEPKSKNPRVRLPVSQRSGACYFPVALREERNEIDENSQNKGVLSVAPALLLSLILSLNVSNCKEFIDGKKGEAPWKLGASFLLAQKSKTASSNQATSNSNDDPLIFGNETNSNQKEGFHFIHQDHLGSTSMFTDGNGDLLTGGQYGGASSIQYKPYGQIDSSASKGPMITDYTYTGQRSDLNTGLMYYKFRYYDTTLGRFISPDDRVFPKKTNGTNLYSYADENPINNNDPSGHSTNYVHQFNQICRKLVKEYIFQKKIEIENQFVSTLSPELRILYGNMKYHGRIDFWGDKKKRSASRNNEFKAKAILAVVNPAISFAVDPAFTLGFYMMAANLAVAYGTPVGWGYQAAVGGTWVENRGGAQVMHNAPLQFPQSGLTIGPFVTVGVGATDGVIRHELGHVDQYYEWGGHEYMGHTWYSPVNNITGNRKIIWAENNADQRSGTNNYGNNEAFYWESYYILVNVLKMDRFSALMLLSEGIIPFDILVPTK